MTIKELYEEAKSMGKEDYEMVTVEMGKDRKYRWYELKPRYGIRGNVVFMETGGEVQNDRTEVETLSVLWWQGRCRHLLL